MRASRAVHFPLNPLTSISRPPSTVEVDAMTRYELHFRECGTCKRTLTRRPLSLRVCQESRILASEVCRLLWGCKSGIYSMRWPDVRFLRVEVPPAFIHVRHLLRAETVTPPPLLREAGGKTRQRSATVERLLPTMRKIHIVDEGRLFREPRTGRRW